MQRINPSNSSNKIVHRVMHAIALGIFDVIHIGHHESAEDKEEIYPEITLVKKKCKFIGIYR